MIESSFSSSSLWDSIALQDLNAEIPLPEFNDCLPSFERNCSDLGSFIALNDLSCSSSDQREDNGLIFEGLGNLPVADSFISQILEESNSTENWPWLDDDIHSLPVENSLASARDSPKKAKKCSNYLSNKSWSKMSPEEQMTTLHALSEIVTCRMGIKQQIKIINIIDPAVTISPDDKEFALDVSCLNDSKMKRITDYVQKLGFSLYISNSHTSKKLSSSSKNDFASKKSSAACKILSRKTNSRTKRRQKKQKQSTDEDVRKKRKLELHGQKEVRSGLFVYEKVIKLSNPPLEAEDEDVNILE